MTERHRHQLELGESIEIQRGLLTRTSVLYAGMLNDRVFSLVVTRVRGHQALAYNLYLPIDHPHLTIAEVPVTIQAVSPATVQVTVG